MLVHFFSSSVSYLLIVLASKVSSATPSSFLNVAADSGRSFAERYAMIDLCLSRTQHLLQKDAIVR